MVSDRAKVTKGLPDVVAIMEGKVRHCQENIRDTLTHSYTPCCDIIVILLCEADVRDSHCGCTSFIFTDLIISYFLDSPHSVFVSDMLHRRRTSPGDILA